MRHLVHYCIGKYAAGANKLILDVRGNRVRALRGIQRCIWSINAPSLIFSQHESESCSF